jgi:hypothetical protein
VLARPLQTALVLVMLAGCGRTQLQPWGTSVDASAPTDVPSDGLLDGSSDLLPDVSGPVDGAGLGDGAVSDGGDAGTDAGVDMSPLPCTALHQLFGTGPLTARRARQALFTPNGRTLLLRVAGEGGAPDDLLRVALPSSGVTTLVAGVNAAEWLSKEGAGKLLLTRPGGALTAFALDGTAVRTLIGASCEHVSAPDGTRVYALHDCDAAGTSGVLAAIDVATGTTTTLSTAAAPHTLVVSPDSQWAAYQSGPGDGAAAVGTVHVVDRGNTDYALAFLAGTRRVAFTPANQLLFMTASDPDPLALADIYRHVPGSGSVLRVAESRNVGPAGYHLSPDGALLLAARFPPASAMLDELYAVHLDGSGETLLASNLAPYQNNQLGPSAFAFSADGRRAIYISNNFNNTSSVSVFGGTITVLAAGTAFAVSPRGDWLAVIDRIGPNRAVDTLHLIDAATNVETVAFDAATIEALTFVPGGRGLLFVALPDGGPQRLRQFAIASATAMTLVEWTTSPYWAPLYLAGEMPASAGYPTDPTGCYAVAVSDLGTAPGTSLVPLP